MGRGEGGKIGVPFPYFVRTKKSLGRPSPYLWGLTSDFAKIMENFCGWEAKYDWGPSNLPLWSKSTHLLHSEPRRRPAPATQQVDPRKHEHPPPNFIKYDEPLATQILEANPTFSSYIFFLVPSPQHTQPTVTTQHQLLIKSQFKTKRFGNLKSQRKKKKMNLQKNQKEYENLLNYKKTVFQNRGGGG